MIHHTCVKCTRARRRGVTLIDVLVALLAIALILAITLPATARVRSTSMTDESIVNLMLLGVAHAAYAVDWNERQYTAIVDDISAFGDTRSAAFMNYHLAGGGCDSNGDPGCHPPNLVGWGDGGLWGFWATHPGSWLTMVPLGATNPFGSFRLPNSKPFHDYVDGRFYSRTFYPPADIPVRTAVEPAFDYPHEYVPVDLNVLWSSYSRSPAALFSPVVLSYNTSTGLHYRDPWSFDDGLRAPPITAATYPHLKTMTMEHHWLQNAPKDRCNPAFAGGTYNGCEPWYFNHSISSEPATLFYDLNVRLLPNAEVQAWDEQLMQATGVGVWSRDTPYGTDGYFIDIAHDDVVNLSHHIFTVDGIQGRDTLGIISSPFQESGPPPERARAGNDLATTTAPGITLQPEEGP